MEQTIVNLQEYSPEWKKQFDLEKEQLVTVLMPQVIAIEHIGSTSVEGIMAKPIIDILVGMKDLREVHDFVQPLKKLGYEYVPKQELKDRRFFRKGEWGKGTVHLHICEFGSSEWIEKILFRDYLRSHTEAAKEYEEMKKKLAFSYKYERQTYTKKKEPFIKRIIEKART
ncbi:GrpB family protein [Gracilibacillus sp. S3-1-1]|uniref:GrpB family protein n=1 Tax=Gracilibacillus pellucidus TaxID=3095368 RepID=A0ACC6M443_9BACI|nr:GrpB family protein [Gracilibacillus sp. S3-1-1]MDX8045750.1 GrpB family protein [Gracilibacillus sp. S3-1-1]